MFARRLYRIILLVCRHGHHRFHMLLAPQHKTVKSPTDYYYLPKCSHSPFHFHAAPNARCLVRFLFEHPPLALPFPGSHSCYFLGRWCRLVYYYLADYVFSLLSTSVLTYNIDNNKKSKKSNNNNSRQQNQHLYHSFPTFFISFSRILAFLLAHSLGIFA